MRPKLRRLYLAPARIGKPRLALGVLKHRLRRADALPPPQDPLKEIVRYATGADQAVAVSPSDRQAGGCRRGTPLTEIRLSVIIN
jgi:hypothetical protein